MKSSDGFDTPTLRECGYAFLAFAENEEGVLQVLEQLGLEWIDNEE